MGDRYFDETTFFSDEEREAIEQILRAMEEDPCGRITFWYTPSHRFVRGMDLWFSEHVDLGDPDAD